jgi:sarcosine oxidase subunit alpha
VALPPVDNAAASGFDASPSKVINRRIPGRTRGPQVTLRFEGAEVPACVGETVAVALFAAGERVLSRSVKYHRPRGFFCLAGSCGACLMRIDGRPNVKACQTRVADRMVAERQNAFPSGGFDVLGAADFFFARGMDHHTMMTSPRALNAVMQKVVRQLGGLGRLPDAAVDAAALPTARARHFDAVVVGAGPAGLAAATALARAGRKTLVIEADEPGGSYLSHPAFGLAAAERAVAEARAAGAQILDGATAFGWYPEDAVGARTGLLAVATAGGLVKLTADRYLYATGAWDQNALFVDNDRPGVLAARAVGRLVVRFGIRPAERPVVLGDGPYARELTAALAAAGAEVTRIDGLHQRVVAARGHAWVKAVEVVTDGDARARRVKCDLVAVAALPAPASELPRQHGVAVELRPAGGGFACVVDADGRSAVPSVFAAGDVTGFGGVEAARAAGARVGAAMARA